jgi:hypothetical protein
MEVMHRILMLESSVRSPEYTAAESAFQVVLRFIVLDEWLRVRH